MSAKRWTVLSACFVLSTPFCLGLLVSFNSTTSPAAGYLFLIGMLVCVGNLVAGLTFIGIGLWQASRRRWALVLQCIVVPGVIAMFVAFPGTYNSISGVADYIHLAVFNRQYQRAVEAASWTEGPRLLWFFWRDASGPLAGETLVYLVFDESDELALPDVQRSAAWKARARKITGSGWSTKMSDNPHHLGGHYYVVHLDD